MTEKDYKVIYGELISRCWDDDEFKEKFIATPEVFLAEYGLPVEEGVEYKVIEAPKMTRYIVLPHEHVPETIHALTKLLLTLAENENPIIVPEGAELRVLQNSDDLRYIIIHPSPDTLTAAELDLISGGDKNVAVNVNYVANLNITTTVFVAVAAHVAAVSNAAAAVTVVFGALVFI